MFVAMDRLSKPSHETMQPRQSQKQDDPFKLGDVVLFYDENDILMNGVVRWIGRNTNVLRNGSKIVGIETVSFYYMPSDFHTYVRVCTYV